jgi:hypothetical protein
MLKLLLSVGRYTLAEKLYLVINTLVIATASPPSSLSLRISRGVAVAMARLLMKRYVFLSTVRLANIDTAVKFRHSATWTPSWGCAYFLVYVC